jgi:hypothetical protein
LKKAVQKPFSIRVMGLVDINAHDPDEKSLLLLFRRPAFFRKRSAYCLVSTAA